MDRIDKELLKALETNSRVSLNQLAKDLDVKTSTIYHRLHKLKESKVLERFTIVLNPEELGLHFHALLNIQIQKMTVGEFDSMFLESFAKYLSDNYDEVLFSSVGSDEKVHVIATFQDKENHYQAFLENLNENPYVESIEMIEFLSILKGKKLFTYIEQIQSAEEGELFDTEDEHFEDDFEENEYEIEF